MEEKEAIYDISYVILSSISTIMNDKNKRRYDSCINDDEEEKIRISDFVEELLELVLKQGLETCLVM